MWFAARTRVFCECMQSEVVFDATLSLGDECFLCRHLQDVPFAKKDLRMQQIKPMSRPQTQQNDNYACLALGFPEAEIACCAVREWRERRVCSPLPQLRASES